MEWKPIPDWPDYEVSENGDVRRSITSVGRCVRPGRVLKPGCNPKGYQSVTLAVNGVHIRKPVHVLVAAAYLGARPKNLQVNHKDGIKINNAVSNLEYVTARQNIMHAIGLGLFRIQTPRKLTLVQAETIRKLRPSVSTDKLAEQFGVAANTIRRIVANKRYVTEETTIAT